MGVYYEIGGEFEIVPPVSKVMRDLINMSHPSYKLRFEPWIVSDDGTALTVEDDEHKNCYDEEAHLVRLFSILTRLGYMPIGMHIIAI